jgi:hypothetical protein
MIEGICWIVEMVAAVPHRDLQADIEVPHNCMGPPEAAEEEAVYILLQ